jgi:hypothetical protein
MKILEMQDATAPGRIPPPVLQQCLIRPSFTRAVPGRVLRPENGTRTLMAQARNKDFAIVGNRQIGKTPCSGRFIR